MEEMFGTDLAGVVIGSTTYVSGSLRTILSGFDPPEIPGAIETIALLAQRFGKRRHAVSMCHPRMEAYSRDWLLRHNFWERTGIDPENLHYCFTREGKRPVCEEFGITHFVDDRVRILATLTSVPNRYLFRPTQHELERYGHLLPVGIQVDSWEEMKKHLLAPNC